MNGAHGGRPGRRRALHLMAAGLAVLVVAWHVGSLGDLGITWDEPVYTQAAERIQTWATRLVTGPDRLGALDAAEIDRVFDWMHYWNPHPPAFREAMAATEGLLGGWMGSLPGYRMASLLWFAALVGGVTIVAGRRWGLVSAAGAGLSLVFMPRLVGHAHVAATDMPLTSLWAVGSLAAAVYVERGHRGWAAAAAACFGLAMSTKFTGYLFPAPLVAWLVWRRPASGRVWGAVGIGAAALVVAWATNPMAWHEPVGYVVGLFGESLSRDEVIPISTYYLGTNYGYEVPWHHPFVMTACTVPLPILALAGLGALPGPGKGLVGGDRGGDGDDRADGLVVLCLVEIAFFLGLLALPGSPNHDGVRLFLPMFPFVALLAGRGLGHLSDRFRAGEPDGTTTLATLLLAVAFLGPAYVQTSNADPYYLSYYNEAIGGPRGADRRGMEATYWYDALTPGFLRQVNRILPEEAEVLTIPGQEHFETLQNLGGLRDDLRITDDADAPYILLYARKSLMPPYGWQLYRSVVPVRDVAYDGVELAGLYVRDRDAMDALREEP